MANADDDRPSGIRRAYSFDAELYEKFQKSVEAIGGSPQTFFRKVMLDQIAKRYLNFETLDADVQAALVKKAKSVGIDNMQTIVSLVLREWLSRAK